MINFTEYESDAGGVDMTDKMADTLLVTAAGSLKSISSRTLFMKLKVSSTTGSNTCKIKCIIFAGRRSALGQHLWASSALAMRLSVCLSR